MIPLMQLREQAGKEALPPVLMHVPDSDGTLSNGRRIPKVSRLFQGWFIERTFDWLGRSRRITRDFQRPIGIPAPMAVVAFIQLFARRVATT